MGIKIVINKIFSLLWVSYKIEANWTSIKNYLIYIIVRPTFTLLLMLFIFVAARSNQQYGYFILVGQAFYNLVGSGIMGVAYTLWDDREHYKILKYIYILPIKLPFYLMGRGMYKYIEGILPLFVSFIIGSLIIQYPLSQLHVYWPLLVLNYLLGFVWILALGFLIASIMFFTTQYGWIVIESIMGSLLLFGNIIFPSSLLPFPLNVVSDLLPIKVWIDLNREIILGNINLEVYHQLEILALLSFAYLFVSWLLLNLSDRIAKKNGLIDIVTSH